MNRKKTANRSFSAGFTLLEVLFAAMLIGLAIAALAVGSGAFTLNNAAGLDLSTAEFLIEEMREATALTAYGDLLAWNGRVYRPPVDIRIIDSPISEAEMPDFSAFAQTITVQYINPADLTQTQFTDDHLVRVTVSITKNNQPISSASWIRADLP